MPYGPDSRADCHPDRRRKTARGECDTCYRRRRYHEARRGAGAAPGVAESAHRWRRAQAKEQAMDDVTPWRDIPPSVYGQLVGLLEELDPADSARARELLARGEHTVDRYRQSDGLEVLAVDVDVAELLVTEDDAA